MPLRNKLHVTAIGNLDGTKKGAGIAAGPSPHGDAHLIHDSTLLFWPIGHRYPFAILGHRTTTGPYVLKSRQCRYNSSPGGAAGSGNPSITASAILTESARDLSENGLGKQPSARSGLGPSGGLPVRKMQMTPCF